MAQSIKNIFLQKNTLICFMLRARPPLLAFSYTEESATDCPTTTLLSSIIREASNYNSWVRP